MAGPGWLPDCCPPPCWILPTSGISWSDSTGRSRGRTPRAPLASRPAALYGAGLKSNYQGQALKLSKHFHD
ncbi:2'-deoxycytidine 5'-triphosphate deaminase domain-containing protein [Falsiroseomonas sp.]|uniref:2'-deoxycytidine 5'-triphosphate deaminase domain-containing protein n=1 Tax=Falsiroseomonas sp. TaxID=2870721 RepID=UPI00351F233C